MPSLSHPVLSAALDNPEAALSGTDLRLELPLTRSLLNEVLAARPAHTPVRELLIDPEAGNRFRVHLTADAPVIGSVTRRITLAPGPAVSFDSQPWLLFDIVDGLKFLDKPLINLMRGQIESRLPKGVDLSSRYLRIHVPALMTHFGYQPLVPLIKLLSVRSENNRLIINLHIKASK